MRVLIGYDGSPSARAAIDTAVEFFGAGEHEFVIFSAFHRPLSTDPLAEAAYDAVRKESRAQLEEVIKELNDQGLAVRGRLVEGEPREILDRMVAEEEPHLVVVGARGQSELTKVLLGSVSAYAVKHLSSPVLVVRQSDEESS